MLATRSVSPRCLSHTRDSHGAGRWWVIEIMATLVAKTDDSIPMAGRLWWHRRLLPLLRPWRRCARLSDFWMVLQILLHGFVPQDETETPLRVHIDGLLQIQLAEIDRMLDPFRAALVDGRKVELVVHEPVVGHVVDGAILQIESRQLAAPSAINVDGQSVAIVSPAPVRTVPPPYGVESQTQPEAVSGGPQNPNLGGAKIGKIGRTG